MSELLKVTHPNADWQLINAKDFDPEVHQLYTEPSEELVEESTEEEEIEKESTKELPPETTTPKVSPRKRK